MDNHSTFDFDTIRKFIKEGKISISIEPLQKKHTKSAMDFLANIFSKEQSIPKELIPLKSDEQKWWCIRLGENILGTVAAWKENDEWHWGRFAVDKNLRGLGLGKKLAVKSFDDIFGTDVNYIVIEARDVTVKLLENLGGEITGDEFLFYEGTVTPMRLEREYYYKALH